MPTPNPAESQKIIYLTRNRKLLSNLAPLHPNGINRLGRARGSLIPMRYALTASPGMVFGFGFNLKTEGRGQAAASTYPQKIPNIPFKHSYV
jgi:hypothetical protein